jgi:hypothetical protein
MNLRIWPFLFLVAASAAHAETYRWVDAEGKVHYSDRPPPASAKQVERRKSTAAKPGADEGQLPYVLQQAVKNFPVTLYITNCGDGCDRARKLLSKRGIPYTEKDAADAETQEEMKKLIGANLEVPILKVGRTVVRGIEEGQWNNALDAAGYPQTAVIPPRPPKRPPKTPPAAPKPATPEEEAPAEENASQ